MDGLLEDAGPEGLGGVRTELRPEQATAIRASGKSNRALAAEYGVTPARIWQVRQGDVSNFREAARTAANAPCFYCGDDPGPGLRRVDYRVPTRNGGAEAVANMVFACEACVSAKGSMTADEYSALLAA